MGGAREAASSAQSNGSVGSLDRSRSMLWARSATSLALGAERRGRIERSMHQTWRFKRVNGTAYPDSIASSLRDAPARRSLGSQRVPTTRIQSSLRDREVPRDGTDLMTSLCDEGGEDDGRRRRDVETAACLMLIRRRRWVIYFHCERNGENRQAWLAQGRCHSRGPETRRQSSASPAHGVSKAAFPPLPRLKAMWSPRPGPWDSLSTPAS